MNPGDAASADGDGVECAPATPDRDADLETFSMRNGKFRYCSCLRWRLPAAEFSRLDRNSRASELLARLRGGEPVGVLAYEGGRVAGWCSVAPRECYGALARSRSIPRVDGPNVWSIVCFFVAPNARGRHLPARLLDAAIGYAAEQGAKVVESYPWPGGSSYFYMGSRELYLDAGFGDVSIEAGNRPVMRRVLD